MTEELKPIEYTNAEIYAMGNMVNELVALKVPASAGIKIKRLAQDIVKDANLIQKELNDLIIKYGEKQEDGTYRLEADSPNRPQYDQERNEMMAEVVTRAQWGPITLPADTECSIALLLVFDRIISVQE